MDSDAAVLLLFVEDATLTEDRDGSNIFYVKSFCAFVKKKKRWDNRIWRVKFIALIDELSVN